MQESGGKKKTFREHMKSKNNFDMRSASSSLSRKDRGVTRSVSSSALRFVILSQAAPVWW